MPEGSIPGLLLFKIFMCVMFLTLKTTYIAAYSDGNKPLVVRNNIAAVIKSFQEIGENIVNCFLNNDMKLNNNKCNLL